MNFLISTPIVNIVRDDFVAKNVGEKIMYQRSHPNSASFRSNEAFSKKKKKTLDKFQRLSIGNFKVKYLQNYAELSPGNCWD